MTINQPAFPIVQHPTPENEGGVKYMGISARDYFAAFALQGILANPNTIYMGKDVETATYVLTTLAYNFANAMVEVGIKEVEKNND
jgi:hypothetical protein